MVRSFLPSPLICFTQSIHERGTEKDRMKPGTISTDQSLASAPRRLLTTRAQGPTTRAQGSLQGLTTRAQGLTTRAHQGTTAHHKGSPQGHHHKAPAHHKGTSATQLHTAAHLMKCPGHTAGPEMNPEHSLGPGHHPHMHCLLPDTHTHTPDTRARDASTGASSRVGETEGKRGGEH